MAEDRRRHERFVIDAPVKVVTAAGEVDGRLHDISAGGGSVEFVAGATLPRLDAGDRVTLALPDGDTRTARVVRRFEGGVGVLFDVGDDGDGDAA